MIKPETLEEQVKRELAILNFMNGIYSVKPQFKSIMIIDDNDIDLFVAEKLVTIYTETEKITKHCCAESALEQLEKCEQLPDLILLDLVMPQMSGIEFLENYQKIQKRKKGKSKVVILSAYINYRTNLVKQVIRFPEVVKFLHKPLEAEVFDDLLEPAGS